eukprot:g19710.t1
MAFESPPEACSLRFNEQGQVVEYTAGYVIDRRQGNTGGRGGLLGPLYAIGKGFPFPEAQPYDAWDRRQSTAVQLLTANGHSGRQFAAYYARMDSLKAAGVQSLHVHHPVVMPAFELRRALARSARSDSADSDPSSSVRVVRLPQRLRTPKEWRDFQGVQLHFWPNGSCTKDEENLSDVPCATDDLTLFLPPPWWLRKILLPYPYPLLPEDDTEIHCSS